MKFSIAHHYKLIGLDDNSVIYAFIFRSEIEQEKGLHSMQIDVHLSGQMVGARPSSAANAELGSLKRSIFVVRKCRF